MNEACDDEELFRRFRDGDHAALEALVKRHARGAARFAAEIVRDAHEGEDIAQESFLKLVAMAPRERFDPERGRFAPFFFRIVRNLSIDRARARRGGTSEIDAALMAPDSPDAAASAELGENREKLSDLVRRLPDGERAALVLREFEGLSYRDIALVMGASLESVKVWIFRARLKLTRGFFPSSAAAASEEGVSSNGL